MLARQSQAEIVLEMPLRGRRDYVHSTDLFAALDGLAEAFLGSGAYLKTLNLRRRAHCQTTACFRPDANAFGTFAFAARGWIMEGWLVENSLPITRRIEFDEGAIAKLAISDHGCVGLRAPIQGYSAFEQLIVLFKMLCAQSHPGAWLLTAIDLDRPLSTQAALAVSRTQLVLGRMIDAMLYQDGSPAGRMQMVLPYAGSVA
ncbi:MAG TPA: hypothetical protein VMO78_09255 [Rhizomicrobium sp.]|nr:hypothetical protein [Rhizomicrobium sp.]